MSVERGKKRGGEPPPMATAIRPRWRGGSSIRGRQGLPVAEREGYLMLVGRHCGIKAPGFCCCCCRHHKYFCGVLPLLVAPPLRRLLCALDGGSGPAMAYSPRKNVLLVDDVEINRMIARRVFMDLKNLALDEAGNGKIAVDLVRDGKKDFHLVLMDQEMPIMDGHEATRKLRSMGVKAPIVAFTSNDSQSAKDQFIRAGAVDFLSKPLKKAELVQLLSKYGLSQ